jgi:hypothetical protein
LAWYRELAQLESVPTHGDRAPGVHSLEVRLAPKSGQLEGGKRRATY